MLQSERCCKRVHPYRRAPDIRRHDRFSGRNNCEEDSEEGQYSRCGGVAGSASVEERRIDRTSACLCVLLLPASAACFRMLLLLLPTATGRYCCLHDFCSPCKCCRCCIHIFFSIGIQDLAFFRLRFCAGRKVFNYDYCT